MGSTSEEADGRIGDGNCWAEFGTPGTFRCPVVVFFNGLSELMSLALSAGGSDPVAEMQVRPAKMIRSKNV